MPPVDPELPAGSYIRKLRHGEHGLLREHLLRLSRDERRMRFLGGVGDAAVERYCRESRQRYGVTLGYFVDGTPRGAGEMLFGDDVLWSKRCEIALSVEGPFQGRGAGTELLRRLILIARNRGIATVQMICLQENERMRAVAGKLGAALSIEAGGVEGRVNPPWPTHLSYLEEAMADGLALMRLAFGTGEVTAAEKLESRSA